MKHSIIISLLLIINVLSINKSFTNNFLSKSQFQLSEEQNQPTQQNQPTPDDMVKKLKEIKMKLFKNENFNTSKIRDEQKAFHLEYSSFHYALSNVLAMEDYLTSINKYTPSQEVLPEIQFPVARKYETLVQPQPQPQPQPQAQPQDQPQIQAPQRKANK